MRAHEASNGRHGISNLYRRNMGDRASRNKGTLTLPCSENRLNLEAGLGHILPGNPHLQIQVLSIPLLLGSYPWSQPILHLAEHPCCTAYSARGESHSHWRWTIHQKWNTSLLPSEENGYVTTLVREGWEQANVSDLMMASGRNWDSNIISGLFNARDRDLIQQEDSVY